MTFFAITGAVTYVLFLLAFILHDGEEVAVQHQWVMKHGDALCERLPMLKRMFSHLRKMTPRAFLIAVTEELLLLVAITLYALLGGPYSLEIWSAAFIAFSVHLVIHLIQAIVVRGYVPGLMTSVLLLPFSILVLQSIFSTLSLPHLLIWTAAGVIVMVVNLAFAHWLGEKMA